MQNPGHHRHRADQGTGDLSAPADGGPGDGFVPDADASVAWQTQLDLGWNSQAGGRAAAAPATAPAPMGAAISPPNALEAATAALTTAPSDQAFLTDGSGASPLAADVGALATAVGTGGSTALQADQLRSQFGVTGAGIKIGVLSDSFNDLGGYNADIASGALPAGVTVLGGEVAGGTDEGRAMLELAHQIAPAAQLYFHTAFRSEADFAAGITQLAQAGCNVIIDDVTYFDEPFFQDDAIGEAINAAAAQGVMCFSSAGNDASNGYQSVYAAGPTVIYDHGARSGAAFDFSPGVDRQILSIARGATLNLSLQWDQPYGAAQTEMDIALFDQSGNEVADALASTIGGNPEQRLVYTNATGATSFSLKFINYAGADPGLLKYITFEDPRAVQIPDANTGTVIGHHEATGAIAVAAASAAAPTTPEFYTSSGAGSELLFDDSGNPLATPLALDKVDLTSVDGIATTVPGGLANFYGTSAAAPTAGAVAALLMQLAPGASSAQILATLKSTATDLSSPGVDPLTGAGLIDALAAGQLLGPAAIYALNPTMTVRTGASELVASLFAIDAPASNAITQYELWLGDGVSGQLIHGSLSQGGTIFPDSNEPITVSSLAGLAYLGGAVAGSDDLWLRAFNGTWSSWARTSLVDTGDTPPVDTAQAGTLTVQANQVVQLSTLLSASDADGDAISQYEIWFGNGTDPTHGSLNQNGTVESNPHFTTTSLAGLAYTGGASAGSDLIWMRASDGFQFGNWTSLDIADAGAAASTPPTVTATNGTVSRGQKLALSQIFSAGDASGDTLTYQLWFGNGVDPTVGKLTDGAGGAVVTTTQPLSLTSLSGLTYAGGATAGSDILWLRAFDGSSSSAWTKADISDLGGVDHAPVVTAADQAVASGQTVALSQIFSASDPDGDAITRYELWFGDGVDPTIGTLSQGGTPAASDHFFPTSLAGLTYTGSATSGGDILWLRAFDGTQYGDWTMARLTDAGSSANGAAVAADAGLASQQLLLTQALAGFSTGAGSEQPSLAPPTPLDSSTLLAAAGLIHT